MISDFLCTLDTYELRQKQQSKKGLSVLRRCLLFQRGALEAPLFTQHIHLMYQIFFLNSYGFQLDENSFGRASLCISLHNTPQCKQTEAAARRLLCLTMVVIKKPHLDFVRTKSEQHPFKLQHPLKLEVKFQKYF